MTDWIRNPHHRVKVAWLLLALTVVGWPLSLLTFAKHEPPLILSLSWLALTLTCLDIVATTDTRKELEDDG